MTMYPRTLTLVAQAELVSLIMLLANLFTIHLKPVAALMGPTHGCAYLFVVISIWRLQEATTTAKALAAVPGVGGLLALRHVDRANGKRGTHEPAS
jgi:hypothetical protein